MSDTNSANAPLNEQAQLDLPADQVPASSNRGSDSSDLIPPHPATQSSPRQQAGRKKAKRRKIAKPLSPDTILNPDSPLAYANLHAMFSLPLAWDVLSLPQKRELISLLPKNADGTAKFVADPESDNPRLRADFLRSNVDFRNGVGRLKDDVAEGRFDEEWLDQAVAAHFDREQGRFRGFQVREFEEYWGEKRVGRGGIGGGDAGGVNEGEVAGEGVTDGGDVSGELAGDDISGGSADRGIIGEGVTEGGDVGGGSVDRGISVEGVTDGDVGRGDAMLGVVSGGVKNEGDDDRVAGEGDAVGGHIEDNSTLWGCQEIPRC